MFKFFLKRLLLAAFALMAITVIVYFLMSLTNSSPIDPFAYDSTADYQAALESAGLDKPVGTRFLIYVRDIFTGRGFGKIYKDVGVESIPTLFFGPLRYTLWVTVPAFLLAIFFGFLLGALAGYKRGTWVDALINVFVIFFSGVPAFILAALALALGGAINWPTAFVKPENGGYKQMVVSLLIPIAVMSLSSLAIYTYYTRNEIVSVLNSNQVMIARSKGLDEWQVFKKHVARNVAIPLVSIMVPSFAALLAGSIVIETFFQIPGSSQIIVNAVKDAEYNVVMFNTLFFVSLGLLLGIITDMLYLWLDPRIKYASATDLRLIRYLRARRLRRSNQKIGVSRTYETLEGDK